MRGKFFFMKRHMFLGFVAGLLSILCLCVMVCIVKVRLDDIGQSRFLAQKKLPEVLEEIKSQNDTAYKYKAEYYARIDDFLLEDGSRTSLEFTSNNLMFWLNGGSCEMKLSGENIVRYSLDSRDVYHYTCYFVPKREGIIKYTRRYNVSSDNIYRTWDWEMETCSERDTQNLFSFMAGGNWKTGHEQIKNVEFVTFSSTIPNFWGEYSEYDFCQGVKELELKLYVRKSDEMLCMVDMTLPDGKTEQEITYCGQTCTIQDFHFQFSLYDKDDVFQVEEDISGVNLGLDKKDERRK